MLTLAHAPHATAVPALPETGHYKPLTAQIAALAGYESEDAGTTDFTAAIRLLNEQYGLGLEEKAAAILGLFFQGGIGKAGRFRGNEEILGKHRENSGTHSCFAALQANEMLERSDFHAVAAMDDGDARRLYKLYQQCACLGVLIHDGGEALGEPLSLNGAMKAGADKDTPAVEREILRYSLLLAAHCLEQYGTSDALAHYQDRMGELRALLEIEKNAATSLPLDKIFRKTLTPAEVELLGDKNEIYERIESLDSLNESVSPESQGFIDQMRMLHYIVEGQRHMPATLNEPTIAEGIGQLGQQLNLDFLMYLVKAAEHVQGGKQLQHFATKEDGMATHAMRNNLSLVGQDAITWERMDISSLMLGQIRYTEAEAGLLFEAAGKDASLQSVARSAVSAIYTLCAKMSAHYGVWAGVPKALNQASRPADFGVREGDAPPGHAEAVMRSRGIVSAVYQAAAKAVEEGSFRPKLAANKTVLLMESLPADELNLRLPPMVSGARGL